MNASTDFPYFTIETMMQPMTVLPMKVSKNIETKDDVLAFDHTNSRDVFSQHIDVQLSKNKELSKNVKTEISQNNDTNTKHISDDQNVLASKKETANNEVNEKDITDQNDKVSQTQDVAAGGNKEPITPPQTVADDDNQPSDESALLMSFLTKADQTLIDTESNDKNLIAPSNDSEITAAQKAQQQAQLLLKSSESVAALSTVAKAVSSTSAQVPEAIIASADNDNPTFLSETLNNTKADVLTDKAIAPALTQGQMNKENILLKVGEQENTLTKSTASNQTLVGGQLPKAEQLTGNDPLAKVMQNENSATKHDVNIISSTATKVEQLVSGAVAEEVSHDSEITLTEQDLKNLIEQSKGETGVAKKGADEQVKLSTDAELTRTDNRFVDSSGRLNQSAYENITQASTEISALTNNGQVSQSQKTNILLHHDTISIFRKDFADAVKDKVMLMISQKLQQFDITLDPPELGNMQVRVNLQGEQASVNFVVQNQQTKEALEQNMHKLRDLLANQGVDVGDANVEQQSAQSQHSNQDSNTDTKQHNNLPNTLEANDVVTQNLSVKVVDSSSKGIDYYA